MRTREQIEKVVHSAIIGSKSVGEINSNVLGGMLGVLLDIRDILERMEIQDATALEVMKRYDPSA